MWADIVAICRDQFSGVALVPSSVIVIGNSTLSENSTPGSVGSTSFDGVGVAALAEQVASSRLSTIGPMQSSRYTPAPRLMPKCDLCSCLGIGMDNHRWEWSYIDPAGHLFK